MVVLINFLRLKEEKISAPDSKTPIIQINSQSYCINLKFKVKKS